MTEEKPMSGFVKDPDVIAELAETYGLEICLINPGEPWVRDSSKGRILYMRASWEIEEYKMGVPSRPIEDLNSHYLLKFWVKGGDKVIGLYYDTTGYVIEQKQDRNKPITHTEGFITEGIRVFCLETNIPAHSILSMFRQKMPPDAKSNESLLTQQQKRCEQYKDTGFGRWS